MPMYRRGLLDFDGDRVEVDVRRLFGSFEVVTLRRLVVFVRLISVVEGAWDVCWLD